MRLLQLYVIFIFANTLYAQDTLAVLNLNKRKVKKIFGQAVDEALFLSVQEQGGPTGILQRNYLVDSVQVRQLDLPQLDQKNLIAIVPNGRNLVVYYVEESGNMMLLKAVVYDGSEATALRDAYVLPRTIPIVYGDDEGLHLVSFDARDSLMSVVVLDGVKAKAEERYKIHPDVFSKVNSFALIRDNHLVTPRDAQAELKFHVGKDNITITRYYHGAATAKVGTHLVHIDRISGTVRHQFVKNNRGGSGSTFYDRGTLYHATIKESGILVTMGRGDEPPIEYLISRKSPFAEERVYTRGSNTNIVAKNRTIGGIMYSLNKPFIVPYRGEDGLLTLEIGTYSKLSKASPTFFIGPPLGAFVMAFAASAVTAAVINSLDKQTLDVSRYFYIKQDPENGFHWIDNSGTLQQRIDTHELFNPENPLEFNLKHYLTSKNEVVAIYLPKGSNKLHVLRYR